jgi:diaminohydroxyphosphoribosylaminopyrimidine deaminase/5-amino-6-(5-phosphoribosylamino)uracil reductase
MSLKKDNFNNFDKRIMKLAINLAINQKGLTGTNPSVGCVIVNNNKIISFAATNNDGRPHAETIALNKNFKKILVQQYI